MCFYIFYIHQDKSTCIFTIHATKVSEVSVIAGQFMERVTTKCTNNMLPKSIQKSN